MTSRSLVTSCGMPRRSGIARIGDAAKAGPMSRAALSAMSTSATDRKGRKSFTPLAYPSRAPGRPRTFMSTRTLVSTASNSSARLPVRCHPLLVLQSVGRPSAASCSMRKIFWATITTGRAQSPRLARCCGQSGDWKLCSWIPSPPWSATSTSCSPRASPGTLLCGCNSCWSGAGFSNTGGTRHACFRSRIIPSLNTSGARRAGGCAPTSRESVRWRGPCWRGWSRVPGLNRRAIVEKLIRAGTVIPLQIDGVRGSYYMLAEDEARLRRHDRRASQAQQNTGASIRFLAPLDNLLWRRERIADFFDFDYTWEVYVPPARRTYGYYTMPILAGDQFVGRFDPRLDRESGRLVINLLHLERGVRATAQLRTALEVALHAFARFHGATDLRIVRSRPARLLS